MCPLTFLFLLSGARVYERAKRMREDERRKRTMLCDVLQYIQDGRACQQWLSKQAAMWDFKLPPRYPVCDRGAGEVLYHHAEHQACWDEEGRHLYYCASHFSLRVFGIFNVPLLLFFQARRDFFLVAIQVLLIILPWKKKILNVMIHLFWMTVLEWE